MADLRTLVEGLGFREVRTLLNSGNVVFSVPGDRAGDVAARIGKALAAGYGVTCQVTILSHNEMAAAVRGNPFAGVADDPSRLLGRGGAGARKASCLCLVRPRGV